MKLSKNEKRILIDLFKSTESLFMFTLHKRLQLSPKELFEAIEKLKSSELITVSDNRLSITKEGVKFLVTSDLKQNNSTVNNKIILEDFLGPKIDINSFYIPKDFNK